MRKAPVAQLDQSAALRRQRPEVRILSGAPFQYRTANRRSRRFPSGSGYEALKQFRFTHRHVFDGLPTAPLPGRSSRWIPKRSASCAVEASDRYSSTRMACVVLALPYVTCPKAPSAVKMIDLHHMLSLNTWCHFSGRYSSWSLKCP